MAITSHTGGAKGYYIHQARLISLRNGLTPREYRSTLAHELGVTRHLLMVWQHMQEVNASFDHSPAASGVNVRKLAPSTPFALKGTS